MSQRKLLTFKSTAKTIKTKLEGKLITIIGKCEFSVSPRSLFSFDGKVHPCTDKSKLMHALEDKAREMEMTVEEESLSESNLNVVIYDGMALVNKLEIGKDVKTCKELKHIFADRLIKESEDFHEVRLVFDRYIEGSLKERTREKRSGGKATRYIIKDSTSLVGVKMKELLSHILTKKDLTIYLAEHCVDVLSKVGKQFVVVFDTKCITNIPQYPEELLQHNQEEADTLILFQAKNVTDLDPFTDFYVISSDTDVLLILIYYYHQLYASSTFQTGSGNNERDIEIRKMHESIGPLHAKAILGFHVFTGCEP